MSNDKTIKKCPQCGFRTTEELAVCPEHPRRKIELREVSEQITFEDRSLRAGGVSDGR